MNGRAVFPHLYESRVQPRCGKPKTVTRVLEEEEDEGMRGRRRG